MTSATTCEWIGKCDSVARFIGNDDSDRVWKYCGAHADRERMNWAYFHVQSINGTVKGKKTAVVKAIPSPGML